MSGKKRILVVDDEPDLVTFLRSVLEDAGYETVAAQDGEEALAAVQQSPPDLITLDISMPRKSGVRFYREMKDSQDWKKIPIIVITGISEDFKKFISTRKQVPPPEGYLSKPVEPKTLAELVGKLLSA
jgi:CheY-like chemotaxis protein